MTKIIESLYLHYPFCKHLCNYCDFFKKVPVDGKLETQEFHQYLESAFLEHQSLMQKHGYSWAPLKTLYLGGGTPSLWGSEGATFLAQFLKDRNITLAPDCEFTLEVNPGGWSVESLEEWQSVGVNRFSLGIQTLDANIVGYLDRVHSIEEVFETLEYFRDIKANFSVDFMLGLPFSLEYNRSVIQELEKALSYNPSHFSVYILTVKDNYKHFKKLPDEEWIEKEFLEVSNFLVGNHFKHYEVSNFGLNQKESQHNLMYWKSKSVAALGPSATGFLAEDKIRYKWKTKRAEIDEEVLSSESFEIEKVYMALRSSIGIDLNHYPNSFRTLAESWSARGLGRIDHNQLFLSSTGYLILDSLMDELFSQKLI